MCMNAKLIMINSDSKQCASAIRSNCNPRSFKANATHRLKLTPVACILIKLIKNYIYRIYVGIALQAERKLDWPLTCDA